MNPRKSRKQQLFNYGKYSSIALQMLVIILLGVLAGVKLDNTLHLKTPVFTIILSLSAVVIAIYFVTRDLLKRK